MPNENEIFEKALDTYGPLTQIAVTVEELSELQQALCKFLRDEGDPNVLVLNIAEEVTDVEITLSQIKRMFCLWGLVDTYREWKLTRLAERLETETD